jgi:nucleoside-diphosphate-sugar epimerase
MMMLVTGAKGFVGSAHCARLLSDGAALRGVVRSLGSQPEGFETIAMGSISLETDWTVALRRVDQVVHLASCIHIMNDKSANPSAEFRRVNVEGTAKLARQVAVAGCRVCGGANCDGSDYRSSDFIRRRTLL